MEEKEGNEKSKSNPWIILLLVVGIIFSLVRFFGKMNRLTDRNDERASSGLSESLSKLRADRIEIGKEYISPVDSFKMTATFEIAIMTPSANMLFWGMALDSSPAKVTVEKALYNDNLNLPGNWLSHGSSREKYPLTRIADTDSTSIFSLQADTTSYTIIKVIRRNSQLYFLTGSTSAANELRRIELLAMFESFRFVK